MTRAGNTDLIFDCDHRLATIGSTTQFHYDGRGNLLATWDGTAGFRKYVYGRGLIALQVGAARYCYHFNGVGSTVALTDMSGAVVNSYAYDPFGVILARNEQVVQPFQFVGQYGVMAEPESLYYMRARHYDPNVGRFISEDPMGFGGGDVNLYAYVRNNPINVIDPLGLYPGQMPPPPPGYNPNTWVARSLPTDAGDYRWQLTDPESGQRWIAHPEDEGHWRHWDDPDKRGPDKRWPRNSLKPWSIQKRPPYGQQSGCDPSGDAPEWTPPSTSEFSGTPFFVPLPGVVPLVPMPGVAPLPTLAPALP